MKKVGLHLRVDNYLTELAKKAVRLKLPFFQFFVTDRKTGRVINPKRLDLQNFLAYRSIYFSNLYIHASYFINLADVKRNYHPLLARELRLAKTLECTHIVLHSGTVRNNAERDAGIDAVARIINNAISREKTIQFLLENTANGKLAIGSQIEDFGKLLLKIDKPERVDFCIDTVHAHVAGYDLVSASGYSAFINLLKKEVGLEKIKLVHLNETRQSIGSYRDIHSFIGEKGAQLGKHSLKRFVKDERLKNTEFLMEMPVEAEVDQRRMLDLVKCWIG